jgi:phage-related holin
MREEPMKEKFYVGSVAGIMAFVASIPHNIRNYLAIVFFLVTVDTVTGILGAIACRELRSSHMRQKLSVKALQYSMFFALGLTATILAESWMFMAVICAGIATAEVSSLVENLAKMQGAGVSMGPFNHAISMLSGFFTTTNSSHEVISTTTATVIPRGKSRDEAEPVISTNVTTITKDIHKP